jgi:hypothetical protein
MPTDDIVAQLQVELSFIERHGTESLNDLDHAALLKWAMDEIERLREELQASQDTTRAWIKMLGEK